MAERSPKPCLPHGWTVHVSKKYPDKVYYFNAFTGDATWECPALDSPRILSENKVCAFIVWVILCFTVFNFWGNK